MHTSIEHIRLLLVAATVKNESDIKPPNVFSRLPFSKFVGDIWLKVVGFILRDHTEATATLLEACSEMVELNHHLNHQLSTLRQELSTLHDVPEQGGYVYINRSLPKVLELPEEKDYVIEAISKLKNPTQNTEDRNDWFLFYSLFENVFYNSVIVKEIQKIYLPYIDVKLNREYSWLDIGCGRGEFLHNLRENNLNASGVDLNPIETSTLQKDGFNVTCMDALQYFNESSNLYSGVSAFQVIEHLDFNYLGKLLLAAYQKLAQGGVIILETLNPHSLWGLSGFHQDPTHIKPIPPELIVFLLQWYGYKNVRIVYSYLLPEETRTFSQARMNYLNYAVIAYKQ